MHKPKKEWNLEGKLCGDCHVDKTKEYYEYGKARQPCVTCGTSYKITFVGASMAMGHDCYARHVALII